MTPNTIITTGQHTTNETALIDPAWLAERDRASRGYLVRKDALYRVGQFVAWLDANGQHWHTPDLEAYRDYLRYAYTTRTGKRGLAAATVNAACG